MKSKFITCAYSNLEREVRECIEENHKEKLTNGSFYTKLKIRSQINNEIIIGLYRLRKAISDKSLF